MTRSNSNAPMPKVVQRTITPRTSPMNLRPALTIAALAIALVTTGCSGNFQQAVSGPVQAAGFSGSVHGGQQPVSASSVQLYAVPTTGYGATATLLATTTTDANGNFTLPSYSCAGVNQVYLTATGGNPGLTAGTNNTALVLMAPLGSCVVAQTNAATTVVNMNEVTTVAGAWALSRFIVSPTVAGVSSTNTTGLGNAFVAANKVANIATGAASGPALPAGATLPVSEINTLANILASCVNTTGSTTAGTPCATLFAAATPPGGSAPTDTFTAALNIARNAANNVSTLFALSVANAPFQPSLAVAPTNFLIGIHYVGGGLNHPNAMAVDASGNVWLTNGSANTVSEFSSVGTALSPVGGYSNANLSLPSGIAIDTNGNAWVSNSTGNSVTKITSLGGSFTTYNGGGLNAPSSVSIDGSGNVWLTNKGNNSVSEFASTGVAISSTNGYTGAGLNQPVGIAVDAQ